MKQPRRTKRPSSENGLPLVLGLVLLAMLAMIPLVGCEPVQVQHGATTMPATEGPRITVARQKGIVASLLNGYVDSQQQLAEERAKWVFDSITADIETKQAIRQGGAEEVAAWKEERERLRGLGEELDALDFLYRASLDKIRLQVVTDFDETYPGWWLMEGAK